MRRVYRIGELPGAIVMDIMNTRMDRKYDYLNAELDQPTIPIPVVNPTPGIPPGSQGDSNAKVSEGTPHHGGETTTGLERSRQ